MPAFNLERTKLEVRIDQSCAREDHSRQGNAKTNSIYGKQFSFRKRKRKEGRRRNKVAIRTHTDTHGPQLTEQQIMNMNKTEKTNLKN